MSNILHPDQARHFVGPDLIQTICKSYQQTTLVGKSLTQYNQWISSQNIKTMFHFFEKIDENRDSETDVYYKAL